ncbi:MAG: hypothetical protein LBH16_05600 [Treponema sp.]|nr:hypothetical protein [Treponema sp.]
MNRRETVERHNPHYAKLNKNAPLSVGNGKFCFTADFTGLQTFYDEYCEGQDAFPLCTMSEWGWHSYPAAGGQQELRLTPFDTYGRTVYYAADDAGQEELFKKIRVNAHKFHLGKIGFEFSGGNLSMNECKPVSQLLSLWKGILYSEFSINGETVKTQTFVHPQEDALYVRAASSLLKNGNLRITVNFPYGSHKKCAADFTAHDSHKTFVSRHETGKRQNIFIKRELDETIYEVTVDGTGFHAASREKPHIINFIPDEQSIEFCVRFKPVYVPALSRIGLGDYKETDNQTDLFDDAKEKCAAFWENYWLSGGFMDFSGSTDKRAFELERRIILSLYLTAIQGRGALPPAETGLGCNSWYGKFHLEMHFWHHAHFALWGRTDELRNSLEYYKKILPAAKETASSQGYSGARWPKMCDPSGANTPSSIAVLLIWQQPHPVMFAELLWRACKCEEQKTGGDQSKEFSSGKLGRILRDYREIVVETAEFMKSFLHWDGSRYVLGPPYIPAQERHDPEKVLNAAFELEYFRWGLRRADEWLLRLGEPCRYGEIAENISLPPASGGLYTAHENCPDTFSKLPFYTDHPSMLAMYGVLDSEKTDREIMSATLDKTLSVWDKSTFYGWDFPMMAMTACRLGRHKDAMDLLLMDSPKNTWLENGHNRQTGDSALPLYLPGNGGLLLAAAMIAAGFGGKEGPLFPDGFTAETEGIIAYI